MAESLDDLRMKFFKLTKKNILPEKITKTQLRNLLYRMYYSGELTDEQKRVIKKFIPEDENIAGMPLSRFTNMYNFLRNPQQKSMNFPEHAAVLNLMLDYAARQAGGISFDDKPASGHQNSAEEKPKNSADDWKKFWVTLRLQWGKFPLLVKILLITLIFLLATLSFQSLTGTYLRWKAARHGNVRLIPAFHSSESAEPSGSPYVHAEFTRPRTIKATDTLQRTFSRSAVRPSEHNRLNKPSSKTPTNIHAVTVNNRKSERLYYILRKRASKLAGNDDLRHIAVSARGTLNCRPSDNGQFSHVCSLRLQYKITKNSRILEQKNLTIRAAGFDENDARENIWTKLETLLQ